MIVKKSGYYVLKTLLFLVFSGKEQVSIRELSDNLDISEKVMEQILFKLKKGGFLKSKRGPNGGYTLLIDPSNMSVWEVLEKTGHSIEILPVEHTEKAETIDSVIDEMALEVEKKLLDKLGSVRIGDLKGEMVNKISKISLNFHI